MMHKLNCLTYAFHLFAMMTVSFLSGQGEVVGQVTAFRTGFEYATEPVVFQPADLNGAEGQIGTWSGDDFPRALATSRPIRLALPMATMGEG